MLGYIPSVFFQQGAATAIYILHFKYITDYQNLKFLMSFIWPLQNGWAADSYGV